VPVEPSGQATVPTLKDVARLAMVSTATASHVINGTRKVRDETRERVFAAIEALGYAGHSIARSLRRGRSAMLGLVVSDIENPFFALLAGHVQRAAAARQFQVTFGNSEERSDREREIIDALSAQRVDGIILAPASQANAALLATRGIPTVIVNRRLPTSSLPHVVVDDPFGASLALDHLWQLGHRRIAIAHGDASWSTTADRLAGVRDALQQHGAVFDRTLLTEIGYPGLVGEADLAAMIERSQPTAVMALSNGATLAAIRALNRNRLRCPEDISLLGYGVTSPYWIPLTSLTMVEQPVAAIAAAAVDLLIAQLSGNPVQAPVVLRPALTVGASSGPVPAVKQPTPRPSRQPLRKQTA
jgi:LacI family transcriptional regulator